MHSRTLFRILFWLAFEIAIVGCSLAADISSLINEAPLLPPPQLILADPLSMAAEQNNIQLKISDMKDPAKVKIYFSDNCTGQELEFPVNDQTLIEMITQVQNLSPKVYVFSAKYFSINGQESSCSNSIKYDLIPQPPTSVSVVAPFQTPSSEPRPTFEVAGVENGSIVRLFSDASCTLPLGKEIATTSSVSLKPVLLSERAHTVYANQQMPGGTASRCSATSAGYQVSMPSDMSLSLGDKHTCVITQSGKLMCWGQNGSGQVGNGTTTNVPTPIEIDPGVMYKSVSAGWEHTCGITINDEVKCWGSNGSNRIDSSGIDKTLPTVVDSGTKYKQISASFRNTCGVTVSGTIKCWGDNSRGQLGIGDYSAQTAPVTVQSTAAFKSVRVGDDFACAIDILGAMYCWGTNGNLALGQGSLAASDYPVPMVVDATTAYAGQAIYEAACGVTTTGILKCWGDNAQGQVGNGLYSDLGDPAIVDAGISYKSVTAGYRFTCGLTSLTGAAKCWGENTNGQLGDSTTTNSPWPVDADPGNFYKEIAGGWKHTCGITTSNSLRCWGWNDQNQLGLGTGVDSNPVVVPLSEAVGSAPTSLTGSVIPSFELASPSMAISNGAAHTLRLTGIAGPVDVLIYGDAACSSLVASKNGVTGTVDFNLVAGSDGVFSYYYQLRDANGSYSTCSTRSVRFEYDSTASPAPTTLTLTSPGSSPNTSRSITVSVGGTVAGDLIELHESSTCNKLIASQIASGTTTSLSKSGLYIGSHTYYARSKDVAGNYSNCSTASVTYEISGVEPSASFVIVGASGTKFNQSPATVNITLSDPSIGFNQSKINVTNATINNFSGSGTEFSIQITPTAEGVVTITIPVGALEYQAGNFNTAAYTISRTYDVTPPYLILENNLEPLVRREAAPFTIIAKHSETLGTIFSSAFQVTNASITVSTSGNMTYVYVTPTVNEGTVTIQSPAGRFSDGINQNTASNTVSFNVARARTVQFGTYETRVSESSGSLSLAVSVDLAHPTENMIFNYVVSSAASSETSLADGQITIPAGQTSATLTVPLIYNAANTGDRSFEIYLSKSSHATTYFGRMHRHKIILTDDEAIGASPAVRVVTSFQGACSLHANGGVKCWGKNNGYSLGTATNLNGWLPPTTIFSSGVSDIALTPNYGCVVLSGSGELKCWGSGFNSTFGSGTAITTPATVIASGVKQISMSSRSDTNSGGTFCAVMDVSGELKCWGDNANGQLGNGTSGTYGNAITTIFASGIVSVSNGLTSTCAINTSGALHCWGAANYVGDGSSLQRNSPVQIVASGAAKVFVTSSASCYINTSGALYCWGYNQENRLGSISPVTKSPVSVIGSGVAEVHITTYEREGFGCAIKTNNEVWCWGNEGNLNYIGINGWRSNFSATPKKVLVEAATSISTFSNYSPETNSGFCIVTTDGEVKCLGSNRAMHHGYNPAQDVTSPLTFLKGPWSDVFIDSQYYDTIFVKKADGSVWGMGDNPYRQLGDLSTISKSLPTYIHALDGAIKISSKFSSTYFSKKTCGLFADKRLKCWHLTDPVVYERDVTDFAMGTNNWNVNSGFAHFCYVKSNGSLTCEGNNDLGQMGRGAVGGATTPYVTIASGVSKVFAGHQSTCAILTDNSLSCWGNNTSGKLGSGAKTDILSPLSVGSSIAEIGIGTDHSCVRTISGDVMCAGQNSAGKLGNGTITGETLTFSASILTGATSIAVGGSHSCALLAGGEVKCWGQNTYGQIGNGTTADVATPTTVVASGAQKIYASDLRTCALMSDGELKCWGYGGNGDLFKNHTDWHLRSILNLNVF